MKDCNVRVIYLCVDIPNTLLNTKNENKPPFFRSFSFVFSAVVDLLETTMFTCGELTLSFGVFEKIGKWFSL